MKNSMITLDERAKQAKNQLKKNDKKIRKIKHSLRLIDLNYLDKEFDYLSKILTKTKEIKEKEKDINKILINRLKDNLSNYVYENINKILENADIETAKELVNLYYRIGFEYLIDKKIIKKIYEK
jgi:hypothetical protein